MHNNDCTTKIARKKCNSDKQDTLFGVHEQASFDFIVAIVIAGNDVDNKDYNLRELLATSVVLEMCRRWPKRPTHLRSATDSKNSF